MASKATIKLIKSLQQKKYRNKTNLFVVEGIKSVQEFIKGSFNLEYLFYLPWIGMEKIEKKEHRFGLIGKNISYSFSKGYFTEKFYTENQRRTRKNH